MQAWHEDPYLESSNVSLDGGVTSLGPLWHAVPPRWGHSMHSMCSYQGSFPPRLPHYFIQRFTTPGDVVLDPFSGRGTSLLQARVEGRRAIGNDLNPLAYVLTRAKAKSPDFTSFMRYLNNLESEYSPGAGSEDEDPDIRMLFHPRTLDQLTFMRNILLSKPWSRWSKNEFFLAAVVAGILHGSRRRDGSSAYLSISMPNTFSMSPAYVARYIQENGLKAPQQNTFEVIKDKAARLFLDCVIGPDSHAYYRDTPALLQTGGVTPNSVDLLVTSPPYLQVMNYGQSNWIRLWWLGYEKVARQRGEGRQALDEDLDHDHTFTSYVTFMERVFAGVARVLKDTGVAAVVIGDVAQPGRAPVRLAEDLWERLCQRVSLRLLEVVEDKLAVDTKVSRIWKDTKGNATNVDRILILAPEHGEPRVNNPIVTWEEPYRDAGPDAAHDRVRMRTSRLA